jgi:methionine salvage enolase-phosphatase E1
MKNFTFLIGCFLMLASCSSKDSDDKAIVSDYHGKWTNVIAVKDLTNPYVWRESYEFNSDNTFTKTRIYKNVTTTAAGTFQNYAEERGINLVLTYTTASTLILNCSSGLVESLTINKAGYLDNNGRMCDAEATYEKTK